MSTLSENLWPFKVVFSFGNSRKFHGARSGMVGGPMSLSIFWPNLPDSECIMSKGIVVVQDPSIMPKVQVFCDEQPHITLPIFPNNNAGSLFNLFQETQSEQFSSVR
jgi:hypothetical protein